MVALTVPGNDPAIIELEHAGSSNFAVISYTASGDRIDLIVNEIGAYKGRHGINFVDGEAVAELEISANGSWTATVSPLLTADLMTTSYQGTGADVILFDGDSNRLTLTHDGDSNFAVVGWSTTGRDLLVNEIGTYSGTVRLDSGTILFTIEADGAWSLTTG